MLAGFGLGALNDADDDDLDVYDGDLRKSRNRTAYDASERDDDFRISNGKGEPKSSMVSRLNSFLKILVLILTSSRDHLPLPMHRQPFIMANVS
jgi:hypothetical protein